ncbi:MAG: ethanolamine utilization protein EutN [Gammaproteobacteria bacterium]|nr:ethanolamine utilization protein EutN [Gammaproteobacteria bacterium]
MKIARITGLMTATVKDMKLNGVKLLVADIEDGLGNPLESSVVVADTCGAGVGELVLVTTGSAARLPDGIAGLPVDLATIAVIDHLDIA